MTPAMVWPTSTAQQVRSSTTPQQQTQQHAAQCRLLRGRLTPHTALATVAARHTCSLPYTSLLASFVSACVAGLPVSTLLVLLGLGRAPATALAYMYWLRGWQLPEAYEALTTKRRCSPRVEAIRAATADLLTDSRPCQLTVGIRRRGTASKFQVSCNSQPPCNKQRTLKRPGGTVAAGWVQCLSPPAAPTHIRQGHAVNQGSQPG
jgi:hypothetical protein